MRERDRVGEREKEKERERGKESEGGRQGARERLITCSRGIISTNSTLSARPEETPPVSDLDCDFVWVVFEFDFVFAWLGFLICVRGGWSLISCVFVL